VNETMHRNETTHTSETISKYEPLHGRLPPAGRFYVDPGRGDVRLFFNYQAVERFGVGVRFRSADLYHIRNHDTGAEKILFELFASPSRGQARLTWRGNAVKVGITGFLGEFEVSFQERHRYPVWVTGHHLYLDLSKPSQALKTA